MGGDACEASETQLLSAFADAMGFPVDAIHVPGADAAFQGREVGVRREAQEPFLDCRDIAAVIFHHVFVIHADSLGDCFDVHSTNIMQNPSEVRGSVCISAQDSVDSVDRHDQNPDREYVLAVYAEPGWEPEPFSLVRFLDEAVPAPAPLHRAEEDEGHAAEREDQVRYEEVLEV